MLKQYYFRINGLDLESDVLKIKKVLHTEQRVEVLEIDLDTGMAVIKSDVSGGAITAMIDAAGYNAILIPE
ncbi:hypothetical protein MNBD_GAMMA07-2109 [hydrothermal vent metagenome]|uniref:Uncharacterized protein n=1 Tax=hydrothermal vent metagenome TaxID=652676 RepID=A0A3B0WF88_9ZZZZ